MDHARFQRLIRNLYEVVSELEEMFPGRPFTPDGHMVGSIGECLAADAYGLELKPPSNPGFDATAPDDREVEIKATQASSVSFRSEPQHTIVIKISKKGTFEEIYNGPGDLVWKRFEGKRLPKNGQYSISLSRLRELDNLVTDEDRVKRVN